MMLLLTLPAAVALFAHPGSPIGAYQNCLAPVVRANEMAGEKNYQPLQAVLQQIAIRCAKERELAAEALAGAILEQNPDLQPLPTAAEKEALIHDATIRWANSVVAQMVAEEK